MGDDEISETRLDVEHKYKQPKSHVAIESNLFSIFKQQDALNGYLTRTLASI